MSFGLDDLGTFFMQFAREQGQEVSPFGATRKRRVGEERPSVDPGMLRYADPNAPDIDPGMTPPIDPNARDIDPGMTRGVPNIIPPEGPPNAPFIGEMPVRQGESVLPPLNGQVPGQVVPTFDMVPPDAAGVAAPGRPSAPTNADGSPVLTDSEQIDSILAQLRPPDFGAEVDAEFASKGMVREKPNSGNKFLNFLSALPKVLGAFGTAYNNPGARNADGSQVSALGAIGRHRSNADDAEKYDARKDYEVGRRREDFANKTEGKKFEVATLLRREEQKIREAQLRVSQAKTETERINAQRQLTEANARLEELQRKANEPTPVSEGTTAFRRPDGSYEPNPYYNPGRGKSGSQLKKTGGKSMKEIANQGDIDAWKGEVSRVQKQRDSDSQQLQARFGDFSHVTDPKKRKNMIDSDPTIQALKQRIADADSSLQNLRTQEPSAVYNETSTESYSTFDDPPSKPSPGSKKLNRADVPRIVEALKQMSPEQKRAKYREMIDAGVDPAELADIFF